MSRKMSDSTEPRSEWRRHARQVIRTALAQLPPDASWKDRHTACLLAYPYREKKGWALLFSNVPDHPKTKGRVKFVASPYPITTRS